MDSNHFPSLPVPSVCWWCFDWCHRFSRQRHIPVDLSTKGKTHRPRPKFPNICLGSVTSPKQQHDFNILFRLNSLFFLVRLTLDAPKQIWTCNVSVNVHDSLLAIDIRQFSYHYDTSRNDTNCITFNHSIKSVSCLMRWRSTIASESVCLASDKWYW